MFGSFDISTSALTAQRTRLDTISSNIANINAHASPDGTPYRRLFTIFQAQQTPNGGRGGGGGPVAQIEQDPQTPFRMQYEPHHPCADPRTGYVRYPNVDLSTEMVNALETTRAYEANITAIETTKSMMNSTLRLLA
ncbi:MAG: flagellar basal body rod protein FlgC [Phycisphaerales bacterium]|nr:flagellar basal body rod protein FlgC [Phycisphaerales bacterium]